MSTQDQAYLQQYVDNIAQGLNAGWSYEQNDHGEYLTEDGEATSPQEYIVQALDVEYTVSSNLEYRGAEIAVALGGPNLFVSTDGYVRGYWGGDRAEAPYSMYAAAELYEAAAEFFEMLKM